MTTRLQKQAAELIPNQTMLINTIPLLEAKDSSEIEDIVTTTDQLFQHVQTDAAADHATKEAPPEGEARLRDLLANWERFIHNETHLDPLDPHGGGPLPVRGHPPFHRW